ncbi:uncharacterized protein [Musca autumnalis]|uniref:uncharacterized protein n=1 Tax=Musca autumnalis TaxID=221902 RepID=UPI003CED0EC4
MAIDFLILAVLLVSFVVNFLALAAFWATPGLRSTANRFTINLLIINLTGCVLLAPTLFLSRGGSDDVGADGSGDGISNTTGSNESGFNVLAVEENDDSIEFYSKPGNHQMTIRHNGKLVEKEGIIVRKNVSHGEANDMDGARTIETIYKCNTTYCRELTIDEGTKSLVVTEIEEENVGMLKDFRVASEEIDRMLEASPTTRSWSIDMAAALGAMAVLLIVGDTWCAVTDPLRYHSRISGVKSWILIGMTWAMGILFGALSAFREIDFQSDIFTTKEKRAVPEISNLSSFNSANRIFGIVFSCSYFLLIILLPFGFVCGMYWRIISEARENGLRMRQNGSSPLLQSAINLTQSQQATIQPYPTNMYVHRNSIASTSSQSEGLQMHIDQKQLKVSPICARRNMTAKLPPPQLSENGVPRQHQELQNIMLTLQTPNDEIERNYSSVRLELFASSSKVVGIRQVHSSPNLQRGAAFTQTITARTCSPHLLGCRLPHNVPSLHLMAQPFQQNHPHSRASLQPHHHSLQIPSIIGSPKSLSYMSSLRHRLSNASSLFKYREESRAARISILVVIMFLLSYLPFGCLVVIQSQISPVNLPQSNQLAIVMVLLAIASSPFIFAYRIKRVRRGVRRLLSCETQCARKSIQRYNSSSSRLSSNMHRNSSQVSAHSANSGHYLTPLNSSGSNSSNIPLRPNSPCITSKNMNVQKNTATSHRKSVGKECHNCECDTKRKPTAQQHGITLVEQLPLNDCSTPSEEISVRKHLFQLFFRRQPNVVCNGPQAAAVHPGGV